MLYYGLAFLQMKFWVSAKYRDDKKDSLGHSDRTGKREKKIPELESGLRKEREAIRVK